VSRVQPIACLIARGTEDTALEPDLEKGSWFMPLPQLPLRTFAALLAKADLFFGNDSGPAHLAAAVGTPSVVMFLSSEDPVRWGPSASTSCLVGQDERPLVPERVAQLILERLRAFPAHRVHIGRER